MTLRFLIAATVALCLAPAVADARPRAGTLAAECGVSMPCSSDAGENFERQSPAIYRRAASGRRPVGCPHRWCGCWLAGHRGYSGAHARRLWVARAWAREGRPASGPQVGAVVVWRHHVGIITAVDGRMIRVLSGNDGNAVRDRWRSTAGVIAYRIAP